MSLISKKFIAFFVILGILLGYGFLVNNNLFSVKSATPTPAVTPTPTRRIIPTPTGVRNPTITVAPGVTPVMYVLDLKITNQTFGGPTSPNRGRVEISPPGISVTSATVQTYRAGTTVTLKAVNSTTLPGFPCIFSSWSGDISSTQSQVNLIMDGNKSATALFKIFSPTVTPPRRPTPRITVTPTQRITETPTPTVTPATTSLPGTPTPTPLPGGYIVSYAVQSDWGAGATVDVTIKNNTTAAVNGWTLAWTFSGNQTITNMWNATFSQTGASVSVKNAAQNAFITANGGSVNFGFNLNYSGSNAKPTSFTLNGTPCQLP